MYVELDRPPAGQPRQTLKFNFDPPETVIPTRRSNLTQLFDDIEKIVKKIQKLDLDSLAVSIHDSLNALKQAMTSFPLNEIGEKTVSMLDKANQLAGSEKWEQGLDGVRKTGISAQNISLKAVDTLTRLDRTIQRLDQGVATHEPKIDQALISLIQALEASSDFLNRGSMAVETANQTFRRMDQRLARTLNDLDSTVKQLDLVIQSLSEQPSRLIFGTTPSSREVESK
jgi:paraquat-inducible protein B